MWRDKKDDLSQEKIAHLWTLTDHDKFFIKLYKKEYRLFLAIQICSIKAYGCFPSNHNDLSTQITNYVSKQLKLKPSLFIQISLRKATMIKYRHKALSYLNFRKYDSKAEGDLREYIKSHIKKGVTVQDLVPLSEQFLLENSIILPGITTIERLVISTYHSAYEATFERIYNKIPEELRAEISSILETTTEEQTSYFNQLKEYPPSASIKSLNKYLNRYKKLEQLSLDKLNLDFIEAPLWDYLYKLSKRYNAREIKRFDRNKRYSLMLCFLIESKKVLLDYLVQMHDQYITEICRECKNNYERKHRIFRKRYNKSIDIMLDTSDFILSMAAKTSISREDIFKSIDEETLRRSSSDMRSFKSLEEDGYGKLLLLRYPGLRKYFSDFINLPFKGAEGSDDIISSIEIIRQMDKNIINKIPSSASTTMIPKELKNLITNDKEVINRNAWEMGIALSIRDKTRSGDLYIPQSKQHVSFWNLMLKDSQWQDNKSQAFNDLKMPEKNDVRTFLIDQYRASLNKASSNWNKETFCTIIDGKLKLKKDDKLSTPESVIKLQKVIESNLPTIRIEKLLIEVDEMTSFTKHFKPLQGGSSRPASFYKTLIAAIISQATNLGIVATSASVQGISVDMLRHVLNNYIREDTLRSASGEIVDHHYNHPLSATQGSGDLSSSDGQRFRMRSDCLLSSYYPRYYGYYEKAVGIYTHVSNQSSVFSTQVISCAPREALYVIDGLLDNNSLLNIKSHTTDTHGYTEIIFALCFLLGFDFMPRIRDLKDQQLYKIEKKDEYGNIDKLLKKTVDIALIEEQWESMVRVADSLKKRITPAHLVVKRLTNSNPNDRLTKSFVNLGRIIKTEYIFRYLTDIDLRRTVQKQLNKGEYRHRIPRWIFFAEQGEFTTGNYEEIMNKASCLSLVSNSILMWNTVQIDKIIKSLEAQGEVIDKETLSHISLLPFRHVLPNGTYFID